MVDQNQFINTYIDVIIATLQEHLKANLQLQTQVKINEIVIAEKDKLIESLNNQLAENVVAEDWKVKYESAESNYSAVMGKLNHMNGLLKQVGDMKKQIAEKDSKIAFLEEQYGVKKDTKKVINTKIKKEEKEETPALTPIVEIETEKPKTLDDF